MPAEHGVIYTKRWVVDFVLDLAGYVSGSGITNKVIVEPSCGCGAFMVSIVERLADEATRRGTSWEDLADAVRGYDIDIASIDVTKRAVVDVLIAKGCPDGTAIRLANTWLIHGDFILSEVPICDFIVGNPPYVRAIDIDRDKRALYCSTLTSVTSGCDLYVSFFDKGLSILKRDGVLCFICADRWLQNAYGRRLRARVSSSYDLDMLVRMHGVDAFDDEVDAYPAVTLIRHRPPTGLIRFVNCCPDFKPEDVDAVKTWLDAPDEALHAARFEAFEIDRPKGDEVYPLGSSELVDFVTQAREKLPSIEESGVRIGIGVATGCDKVFITDIENLVEPERMLPVFSMRDYRRGHADKRRWLVNPWNDDGTLVDLDEYPKLKAYFEKYTDKLCKRHVARNNDNAWYRTIDKLTPGLMDRDLLFIPDMATTSDPVLSRGLYPAHNTYWIASDTWDMRTLGGFLMADTTRSFIDALGVKMRGGTLRFQAQYLRLVHIPAPTQVNDEVKAALARSFDDGDRNVATHFAEIAYKEAMR